MQLSPQIFWIQALSEDHMLQFVASYNVFQKNPQQNKNGLRNTRKRKPCIVLSYLCNLHDHFVYSFLGLEMQSFTYL